MTRDVCDVCWGSGEKDRPFTDLRKWMEKDREMSREQAFQYLQRAVGASYSIMKKDILTFADIIEKEMKRRKLPEGTDEYWYKHNAEVFARILRKLCGEKVEPW